MDFGVQSERAVGGKEGGFVVSVVRSSGSSRKIGSGIPSINMKNNDSKKKKDREVGQGERKFPWNNNSPCKFSRGMYS